MKNLLRPGLPTATLLVAMLAGCSKSPDDHIADIAQQSLDTQARQNQQAMEQNQGLVEASKELVAADAAARAEMVTLSRELQAERREISRRQDDLEGERREIARQRHRDPLVAAAITTAGVLVACLLPLIVAIFVLHRLWGNSSDDEVVAELLLTEVIAEQPRLLPGSPRKPASRKQPADNDETVSSQPERLETDT